MATHHETSSRTLGWALPEPQTLPPWQVALSGPASCDEEHPVHLPWLEVAEPNSFEEASHRLKKLADVLSASAT